MRAYKAEQKTINYAAAVVGGQVQLFINLYIYIYSLVIFIKKIAQNNQNQINVLK